MLYHYPFPSRLKWMANAFKRGYQFVDENGHYMGKMEFSTFGKKIQSELNGVVVNFLLQGVFIQKVLISDEEHEPLGTIKLGMFGKSTINLKSGEVYLWKSKNIFQTRWQLIHDLPSTDDDPISVNYQYLHRFVQESGEIELYEESNQSELLTLIGFFLGMYFIRQRRKQG